MWISYYFQCSLTKNEKLILTLPPIQMQHALKHVRSWPALHLILFLSVCFLNEQSSVSSYAFHLWFSFQAHLLHNFLASLWLKEWWCQLFFFSFSSFGWWVPFLHLLICCVHNIRRTSKQKKTISILRFPGETQLAANPWPTLPSLLRLGALHAAQSGRTYLIP